MRSGYASASAKICRTEPASSPSAAPAAAGPPALDGAVAGLDHGLEGALLVARVALDRGHQRGDQVVPALELDVDVGPGVGGEQPEPGQAVVGECDEDGEGEEDHESEGHRPPENSLATSRQTASDRLLKVKSRIRIGGIITLPWVWAPCTRTGRPSASRLLSMMTGDSLNRKFLIAYAMRPCST